MKIIRKTNLYFLLLILFSFSTSLLPQSKYVQGEILVYLNDDLMSLPMEVYAAFVSIEDETIIIKIDSIITLTFKPGTRMIEKENIISYIEFSQNYPNLISLIKFNFPNDFVTELKKADAYRIGRSIKSFFPSDTMLHYVKSRRGRKLSKSPNYNKNLLIKYKAMRDAKEVAEEFQNLNCVRNSSVNHIIIEEDKINPVLVHKQKPVLDESIKFDQSSNVVVVTVTIDTLGNVINAVIFSSENKILNNPAMEAAKKCQFVPGTINGKKKIFKKNISYTF